MLDPYKILDVPRDATVGEIKKAYFRLIKHHTPEKEPEKFKEIRAAYEKLRTDIVRTETEMLLFKEPETDFQGPPVQYSEYNSKITQHDIFEMVVALFSDFNKTDFSDDYSKISF